MNVDLRDTLTDEQILDLHEIYQAWWWTEERELDDLRLMRRNREQSS